MCRPVVSGDCAVLKVAQASAMTGMPRRQNNQPIAVSVPNRPVSFRFLLDCQGVLLISMVTELESAFPTAKSSFPSPLKSAATAERPQA
jgi:hypothetical protein